MERSPLSIRTPWAIARNATWQVLVLSLFLWTVLENEVFARTIFSDPLWTTIVTKLGGTFEENLNARSATLPAASVLGISVGAVLFFNLLGTVIKSHWLRCSVREAAVRVGLSNSLATMVVAAWMLLWFVGLGSVWRLSFAVLTCSLSFSVMLAGWMSSPFSVRGGAWALTTHKGTGRNSEAASEAVPTRLPLWIVGFGILVYIAIFVWMNWGLWFNLLIPHGDSSMYEEHLWNLLHGKGFRSYLDQGLFLGEHIQVIHLLLLPIYFFWPSHLLLELAESTALALSAIPIYWIAARHGANRWAAVLVALAYLCYFPMHYIDISIDMKTFRPIAFGIPAMLFAINAMERRRWTIMTICCLLALSSKEDYALVLAPLGVWMIGQAWWRSRREPSKTPFWKSSPAIAGAILAVGSTAYLAFVVKVAIPWFREGGTVHYVRYFENFGSTPQQIVWRILTRPDLLFQELATPGSLAYLLYLLVPLGFPVRSGGRLLVALPLFVLLCLNELAQQPPGPVHHFHAPIIPIVMWACAASLAPRANRFGRKLTNTKTRGNVPGAELKRDTLRRNTVTEDAQDARRSVLARSIWILCCALCTGLFFTMSPLGIGFWDPGSDVFWRNRYVMSERAREFEKIPPLIPKTARVASTDFVHPRFTHWLRSYDYSRYPRRVANYEDKVPDDTDYIVIDTGHRYSEIHSPKQIREMQRAPEDWEVVPTHTHGYFIVLKRIHPTESQTRQEENR